LAEIVFLLSEQTTTKTLLPTVLLLLPSFQALQFQYIILIPYTLDDYNGKLFSPIVSNIFLEHFEKLALDSAQYKPSLELQYVDGTFVIWLHGPERLQDFLNHLNNLRPSIQFTMEIESNSAIPFMDALVIRKGMALATKVYRKPTHTDRYLYSTSNHSPHVKRRIIQSSQYSFNHIPRTTRYG
jgi:hypothetical protein